MEEAEFQRDVQVRSWGREDGQDESQKERESPVELESPAPQQRSGSQQVHNQWHLVFGKHVLKCI